MTLYQKEIEIAKGKAKVPLTQEVGTLLKHTVYQIGHVYSETPLVS